MKRNIIIRKLTNEGLSNKTLVNMTDKQLKMLSERMIAPIDAVNKNPRLKAIADDPIKTIEVKEDKKWIQKAFNKVEKKGTEGKCTGKKFGSPGCPKGSKAYNMSKNLRKINTNEDSKNDPQKNEKKEIILGSKEIKETKKTGNISVPYVKNVKESKMTTKNEIMELVKIKLNEAETMDMPVATKKKSKNMKMPDFMTYDAIKLSRNGGEKPSTEPNEPDIETMPDIPKKEPTEKPKPRTPYQPWPGTDPYPKGKNKEHKPKMTSEKNKK